jgi:hypothetical protein
LARWGTQVLPEVLFEKSVSSIVLVVVLVLVLGFSRDFEDEDEDEKEDERVHANFKTRSKIGGLAWLFGS